MRDGTGTRTGARNPTSTAQMTASDANVAMNPSTMSEVEVQRMCRSFAMRKSPDSGET
jgi:hypothetical protein